MRASGQSQGNAWQWSRTADTRRTLIAAAGVTLIGAGLLAATAPPESVVLLSVALVLLGLGWNLGLVAGTALVGRAASGRDGIARLVRYLPVGAGIRRR